MRSPVGRLCPSLWRSAPVGRSTHMLASLRNRRRFAPPRTLNVALRLGRRAPLRSAADSAAASGRLNCRKISIYGFGRNVCDCVPQSYPIPGVYKGAGRTCLAAPCPMDIVFTPSLTDLVGSGSTDVRDIAEALSLFTLAGSFTASQMISDPKGTESAMRMHRFGSMRVREFPLGIPTSLGDVVFTRMPCGTSRRSRRFVPYSRPV